MAGVGNAGQGFTPHVINVTPGEVGSKHLFPIFLGVLAFLVDIFMCKEGILWYVQLIQTMLRMYKKGNPFVYSFIVMGFCNIKRHLLLLVLMNKVVRHKGCLQGEDVFTCFSS